MLHGITTDPLVLGLGAFAIGAALWAYKKMHRVTAWMFGAAAFAITVSVPSWLDSLASLTSTVAGMTGLTVATILLVLGFWFEAIRKHKHHRIRTPVISGLFGIALTLVFADWTKMISSLGTSTSQTGSALSSAMKHVQNGTAAHAVTPNHRALILLLAVAVIAAIVVLAVKLETKKGRGSISSGSGPRRTSGGPMRRALTSGKAR
jgi:hypothetical protein